MLPDESLRPESEIGKSDAAQAKPHSPNLELVSDLKQPKKASKDHSRDDAVFKLLVASVTDYAIFMLGPDGTILTWNEGAQRAKGYTADEVIGKHFSLFYTDESRARKHPESELVIATETGRYEEEGWRVRKDGTLFWANVVITALYEDGELVGFAKVTRNLTERKAAEEAREAAFAQVARMNEELQHLAYVISHELQEPLSAITSYTKLLSSRYQSRLGDDADEFIDRVQTGARVSARLVDDLWTYARVTKPGAPHMEVSSGAVLRNTIDELKDLIERRKAAVTHPPFEQFPLVSANKEQLMFVFKELLTNAIKHDTGSAPHINVSVEQDTDKWIFSFKDSGPGLDKFYEQQAFTVYQRINAKVDEHGTGMGLPICKKIIEDQHGGKLTFESEPGHGCTFIVELPRK